MTSTEDGSNGNGQPSETSPTANSGSPTEGAAAHAGDNQNVPKPKRLACMICRKRKLRCDGVKPSCSTCTRLGHSCAYDEVRRKSGPKRGYVKALEERLKQVETLLKTQEPVASNAASSSASQTYQHAGAGASSSTQQAAAANFNISNPSIQITSDRDMDRWHVNPPGESPQAGSLDDFSFNASIIPDLGGASNNFTYEIMQLGLQEPLPPQETIDELHQIFFQKILPTCPIIHKYRYLAAMNLAPTQRPPVCLRYAMWTLACSITDKYHHHKDVFYERARRYLEADYIKGHGEHMISAAHAQTHILLAKYELKMMYFPRAWMSTGAGVRLCQMMGLHRLDGAGLDVKQCVPPPRDWTEREERRRTFWMAFCEDRYASIGTGWPMTIDENDIFTNLPASDEAFELSRPESTQSLSDAMSPSGAGKLSPFGGIVLMACLFGKNLIHLHRPDPDDRNHDLNGEFWKRHRHMDNILLNTSLCLPAHLKLPAGLQNSNVVFTNMCIHTSTICLHQAAIFTADKHNLPASVSAESKIRCITAANEIASIMRMISHMDLSSMNPFISFCLYVAARVFVQYLKSLPDDSKTIDSLRFLLSAMNALKRRNPLTESFLVQLDVDLEALGMRIPKLKALFPRSGDGPSPKVGLPKMGPCDEDSKEGPHRGGIMAYRNECHFMKMVGDDANLATAPDIIPPSEAGQRQDASMTGTSGSNSYHSGQAWSPGDQQHLPHRERRGDGIGSGSGETLQQHLAGIMMQPTGHVNPFDKGNTSASGRMSDSNDLSVSPDAEQSNRPTPNSSTASEHLLGSGGGNTNSSNLGPTPMSASGGSSSFSPSPVPAHQTSNLGAVGDSTNIFSSATFGLGRTGMTPNQRFSMPDTPGGGFGAQGGSWDMPGGPQEVTPVGEGMLRSLLNMGSLEMMDMNWDSGT